MKEVVSVCGTQGSGLGPSLAVGHGDAGESWGPPPSKHSGAICTPCILVLGLPHLPHQAPAVLLCCLCSVTRPGGPGAVSWGPRSQRLGGGRAGGCGNGHPGTPRAGQSGCRPPDSCISLTPTPIPVLSPGCAVREVPLLGGGGEFWADPAVQHQGSVFPSLGLRSPPGR